MIVRLKKLFREWFTAFAMPESVAEKWTNDYFQIAASWADDIYTTSVVSRNRWRFTCLYVLVPLSFLLLMAVVMLIPLQHIAPILIHHYDDGVVSAMPLKKMFAPTMRSEIESDIVRYVVNRESYSDFSYEEQFSLVNLLSNSEVEKQYIQLQSSATKNSPINALGQKAYRSVHVTSVLFLDTADQNRSSDRVLKHRNLAQINFTITDHDKTSGATVSEPLTALISWEYRGLPGNPEEAWKNWSGFTVTHYDVQQRRVSNE